MSVSFFFRIIKCGWERTDGGVDKSNRAAVAGHSSFNIWRPESNPKTDGQRKVSCKYLVWFLSTGRFGFDGNKRALSKCARKKTKYINDKIN